MHSIRVIGVPAEIRSRYLSSTSRMCYVLGHFELFDSTEGQLNTINYLMTNINWKFRLNILSVPRSKHTPSQLYKPVS